MFMFIVVIAIAAFIIYKVKEEKDFQKYLKEKEDTRAKQWAERKKNGEPSVCTNMPVPSDAKLPVTGPDGKKYPGEEYYFSTVVIDNYSSLSEKDEEKKYEYDPVYCMLVYEHWIRNDYLADLKRGRQMHPTDIANGISCMYDLAESYAYPVAADNDLTQADGYTIRRLKDRERAMKGNGYYKNAYGFPINAKKALEFYQMPEMVRTRYENYFAQCADKSVSDIGRSWMKMAHLYSAGQGGVKPDYKKAHDFYSTSFQIAMHYSKEDMAFEIIHAMVDGYPRNPEEYSNIAYNMLADWACRSDFGLAMYVEYMFYTSKLNKAVLAKSPEAVVELCKEMAPDNQYAAYLLGRALLYGYGAAKNEETGRELLRLAAEAGCISALYLLKELSIGNSGEEKKWREALDRAVAKLMNIKATKELRAELEKEGKSVTKKMQNEIREQAAGEASWSRYMEEFEEEDEAPEKEKERHDVLYDIVSNLDVSFHFPQYIYDYDENPWELMNSGGDNANYYCQKTGETRMFYSSDFEYEAPSGFHRR